MSPEQLNALMNFDCNARGITTKDLAHTRAITLYCGRTVEDYVFHLYRLPNNDEFEWVIYDNDGLLVRTAHAECINKPYLNHFLHDFKFYVMQPDRSDFEFCELLLKYGLVDKLQVSHRHFDEVHPGAYMPLDRTQLPPHDLQQRKCHFTGFDPADVGVRPSGADPNLEINTYVWRTAASLVGLYLTRQDAEADSRLEQIPAAISRILINYPKGAFPTEIEDANYAQGPGREFILEHVRDEVMAKVAELRATTESDSLVAGRHIVPRYRA